MCGVLLRAGSGRMRESVNEISRNRVVKFRTSTADLIRFRVQNLREWVFCFFVSRTYSERSKYARSDVLPVPGWALP